MMRCERAVMLVLAVVTGAVETVSAQSTWTNLRVWGGQIMAGSLPDDVPIIQLAAGGQNSAVIAEDGGLVVWGDNQSRQCEIVYDLEMIGERVSQIVLGGHGYDIPGGDPKSVDARGFSLALSVDGRVHCRGATDEPAITLPRDIAIGRTRLVQLAAGFGHVVAITTEGGLVGWGDDAEGQAEPPIDLDQPVAQVVAGATFSMALLEDGGIVVWGSDEEGQWSVPGTVGTPDNPATSIAAGWNHGLAIDAAGRVHGWGSNSHGQTIVPQGIGDVGRRAIAIAAGAVSSMALLEDGTIEIWGEFRGTQPPADLGLPGRRAASIAASGMHAIIQLETGEILGLGLFESGAGQGPLFMGSSEDPVVGCAIGEYAMLVVTASGRISCFGEGVFPLCNVPGVLGLPGTEIARFAGSGTRAGAIFGDGYLAVWGLGISQPIPDGFGGPDDPVVDIDVNGLNAVAMTRSGRTWCDSILGLDSCSGLDAASDGLDLQSVVVGDGFTLGLREDGVVVGWGGDAGKTVEIPEEVLDSENPVRVVDAGDLGWAVRADGSVIAWTPNDPEPIELPDGVGTAESPVRKIKAQGQGALLLLADGRPVLWRQGWSSPELAAELASMQGWVDDVFFGEGIAVSRRRYHLADLDEDGCVSSSDLGLLLVGWGDGRDSSADLDGDGVVGAQDLGLLLAAWSDCRG